MVNPSIISSKAGVQHLVPEVEAVHDVHLWILVLSSNEADLENIGILFCFINAPWDIDFIKQRGKYLNYCNIELSGYAF